MLTPEAAKEALNSFKVKGWAKRQLAAIDKLPAADREAARFFAWSAGEPNDSPRVLGEDHAVLRGASDGQWNDANGVRPRSGKRVGYMCEWEPSGR